MTDINGKRVLITGAAGGIGRALTTKLAHAGAQIVLWDIDAEALAQFQAQLDETGYAADIYVCDLTSREEVSAVARRTLAQSGPVDILINNAGVVSGKNLLDMSDEEIERTFQVNSLALFRTVRAFLPSMLERARSCIGETHFRFCNRRPLPAESSKQYRRTGAGSSCRGLSIRCGRAAYCQ